MDVGKNAIIESGSVINVVVEEPPEPMVRSLFLRIIFITNISILHVGSKYSYGHSYYFTCKAAAFS